MAATAKRSRRADQARPESPGPDQWVTTSQAAAIIGRDPRAVRRLSARGFIRAHRPPGTTARFFRPDCEKYSPRSVLSAP